jgi:presenilin-like A22 family membrane protease
MNIKKMIFSGIMMALIGVMIGTAVSYIDQREQRRKPIIITGATLGFIIGAMQQAVNDQKQEREDEYEE